MSIFKEADNTDMNFGQDTGTTLPSVAYVTNEDVGAAEKVDLPTITEDNSVATWTAHTVTTVAQ
jgi:hypothetical protein